MAGLNLYAYPVFQSGYLIGDFGGGTNAAPGNSADALASWTFQDDTGGTAYPIASALEIKSVYGGLVVPRMTTAQRDAMGTINTISTGNTLVANGTIIYNTTDSQFNLFEGDTWLALPSGAGTGDVNFVGAAPADNELVRFDGITGFSVQAGSGVIIDDTANISAVNTIQLATGSAANPSYTFTGDASTGMYSSAGNTIDFATGGLRQLQIANVAASVNCLKLAGSATGTPVQIDCVGTDGNISIQLSPKGTGSLQNAVGAIATPSYSFVGQADTGMWSSAAATIDFSTTGGRQFQIDNVAAAVNWISVIGGATVAAGAGPGEPVLTANGSDALVDVAVKGKGAATGLSVLPNSAAGAGQIKLWNGTGTFWSTIKSAAVAANKTWTLPLADATIPGEALVSDAAGTLSFASTVQVATGTLSTANIAAMYGAPVVILPAAPAGFAYIVKDFYLELVFATAAPAAGGDINIQYGATVHGGGTNAINSGTSLINSTLFTGAAANQFEWIVSNDATSTTAITNYQAAAIYISNDTAAFTANGGTSTARYSISYVTVPMP